MHNTAGTWQYRYIGNLAQFSVLNESQIHKLTYGVNISAKKNTQKNAHFKKDECSKTCFFLNRHDRGPLLPFHPNIFQHIFLHIFYPLCTRSISDITPPQSYLRPYLLSLPFPPGREVSKNSTDDSTIFSLHALVFLTVICCATGCVSSHDTDGSWLTNQLRGATPLT